MIYDLSDDLINIMADLGTLRQEIEILDRKRQVLQSRYDDLNEQFHRMASLPCAADRLTYEEQQFCRSGHKIQAIKAVRGRTGLGLKESKDLVDAWIAAYFPQYRPAPTSYYDYNE